jgi:hypothetical protein
MRGYDFAFAARYRTGRNLSINGTPTVITINESGAPAKTVAARPHDKGVTLVADGCEETATGADGHRYQERIRPHFQIGAESGRDGSHNEYIGRIFEERQAMRITSMNLRMKSLSLKQGAFSPDSFGLVWEMASLRCMWVHGESMFYRGSHTETLPALQRNSAQPLSSVWMSSSTFPSAS